MFKLECCWRKCNVKQKYEAVQVFLRYVPFDFARLIFTDTLLMQSKSAVETRLLKESHYTSYIALPATVLNIKLYRYVLTTLESVLSHKFCVLVGRALNVT
jgi:hypothetical protein